MLDNFGCLPVALDFYLDSHDGPAWEVSHLRGRSGWLSVAEVVLETPLQRLTGILIAACLEGDHFLPKHMARHLVNMSVSFPSVATEFPPEHLDEHLDMLYWDFLGTCDLYHLNLLKNAEQELQSKIKAEEHRAERIFELVDDHVAKLRRDRRRIDASLEQREQIDGWIGQLEAKQRAAAQWLRSRTLELREEAERFESLILSMLTLEGRMERLYTVYWTARHRRDRTMSDIDFRLVSGLPQNAEVDTEAIARAETNAKGSHSKHAKAVTLTYEAWKEKDAEKREKEKTLAAISQHNSSSTFKEKPEIHNKRT